MGVATDHVNDIITKISTISAVKEQTVHVYNQEALLSKIEKIHYPAIGVMYVGLQAVADSSKTGLADDLICDVYVIGADLCKEDTLDASADVETTQLLDDIRDTIKCSLAPSKRKWEFVFEIPTDIADGLLAYVQRWKTRVVLT